MKITLAKRATAYAMAACLFAQPALAAVTDISAVPLASSAGANFLPNLLFTLDDSGSMDRNYNPDYANDSNTCMNTGSGFPTTGGSTACQRGDPPFDAGGQNGLNGVGYDPNFTYLPGLSPNGQPVLNPPTGTLSPTAVTPDAYLGGTSVNLTTSSTERRFCNSNGVCKRNGADGTGAVLPVGIEVQSFTQANVLGPGQFPYRTNPSSASLTTFGLPEMMSTGTFSRASTTVTVNTVEAHGLAVGDRILVAGTGSAGMDLGFPAVATVPNANQFTYASTTSGNIAARNGFYRKYGPGSFERSGNTVTVTTTNDHLVVTGDVATFVVPTQTAMNAVNATITVTGPRTFTYTTGGSGVIPPTPGLGVRTGLYNIPGTLSGPPAVYGITPIEYCSDVALTNCVLVIPPATPPASHPFPAYVRFCRSQAEALAPGAVSALATTPPTPRCQLKYVNVAGLTRYIYPRYGWFTRDTVVSTVASYGNRPNRSDCTGAPNCTYAEEIQNYAKWFAYYSNRMRMMKTAAGRAFLSFVSNPTGTPPRPDRIRIGFITINPTTPNGSSSAGTNVHTSKYLNIGNFDTTHAGNWYNKFYAVMPGQSTPLRTALSRAGWIFSGKLNTDLTAGIPVSDDPIQASCQKNYSIFTTDGFWNQGVGKDLANADLLNHDNVDNQVLLPYTEKMVSRATGTYDGNILNGTTAGTSPGGRGTLADVALYYYKTDLRGGTDTLGNPTGPATSPSTTPAGGDVSTNNVLPGPKDFVQHQHMVTFTVGLADGLMRYQPDYESALTGDFANIRNAATGCFWAAGTCNWPAPQADGQSALDDLWHAAVNGRGNFYSALNPNALATGLADALNKLDIQFASAAAAATSSPNIASGTELAFSTRYQTATWSGEAYAQKIDPLTGQVADPKEWQAHKLLLAKVSPSADTRSLWMFDPLAPAKLKPFSFPSMTLDEQRFFSDKCSPVPPPPYGLMTQCTTLSPFQLIDANDGDKLVRFLRGQTELETTVFRDRTQVDDNNVVVQTVLGDIVNAQPLFVPAPFFEYTDPGYPAFKTAQKSRRGTLYIAANDGYLHAFDGNTGVENWAYMPRFVMPGLYQLADSGYAGKHRFFLDGTPEFQDVFDGSAWRTIVVGGANSGARGYYALDITDPFNPKGLWEFCNAKDLSGNELCAVNDPDLGLTYGNPVIGKRKFDGKWVVVVTSGVNNVTPGNGSGHFYVLDAITGQILDKVSTGSGTAISPSGLMKIGGWYDKGLADAQFDWVYGGDQNGDIWRLDMNQSPPALLRFATLKENPLSGGRLQPITARPVATPLTVTGIGRKRIVYFATGRYLGNSDLADAGAGGSAWVQSIYGLMDKDTGVSLGDVRASGTLQPQTLSNLGPGRRAVSKNPVDWLTQNGFYIDLLPDIDKDVPTDGERVVLDLQLVLGTLVITSTIPEKGGCTPGGFSYQYNLDFRTGGYVGNSAPADGSGFKTGLIVGTAIVQTSDGSIKAINKSFQGQNTPANVGIEPFTQMKRFSYRER